MNALEKHQRRVRDLLGGQDAPLIDGQRHILGHCPHCDRIWLQRGGANALHLTPEDIRTWAQLLHADSDHLPHRVCRACQLRLVGGEFAIDEYVDPMRGDIGGYGVSWECGTPPQHCIVTATKVAWLDRQPFVPEPSIVTNASLCEAVLRSLAHLPPPARAQPFDAVLRSLLTRTNPPGAHAPGTEGWTWHGEVWTAPCRELAGEVLITFAQALPPTERFQLPDALALWRQITLHALQFGIEGV